MEKAFSPYIAKIEKEKSEKKINFFKKVGYTALGIIGIAVGVNVVSNHIDDIGDFMNRAKNKAISIMQESQKTNFEQQSLDVIYASKNVVIGSGDRVGTLAKQTLSELINEANQTRPEEDKIDINDIANFNSNIYQANLELSDDNHNVHPGDRFKVSLGERNGDVAAIITTK